MTGPSVLDVSPVIPVVVLDDAGTAVPLARALLSGGIGVVELALRTAAALDAGARFLVSPRTTRPVVGAARRRDVPLPAGVATASGALPALGVDLHELTSVPAGYLDPVDLADPADVGCVGGHRITPPDGFARRDSGRVEEPARAAVALR
ncbi:beta/alpha barrel domain-containing protein [Kineococcus sp. SYSU DK001]|uniref:hypothetical protein n=1 Tax=Kineococcus sp. SYSU DK001 TaxID=3383122 RepID=UPI003D7EB25D